ncbi:uncharacterized protein LOC120630041 [Pararge aegeria]|uniref:Jg23448 protein n=2 Tax=Pararge aegeria TaxID=116150 RepID=A0A8S4S3Z6_9NEOP|nr:uncharacterized protein LOC120630041 [Pararge aegeria]CAH2244141.1 jg23448 [Pararge aegeria aegeria]
MSVSRVNTSFNSSSSSQYGDIKTMENEGTLKVKDYVKNLLKSRIFLGRYLERRLADQRIGYRDIVKLSPAEVELKRDLLEAQCKLQSIFPNTHWVGISSSEAIGHPSGICIWTEIENQPFGVFWFQIKSIKFRDYEVIITLKCLRHITDAFIEVEPLILGCVERSTIDAKLNDTANEIVFSIKNAFTLNSIKEFITFIFAFIIAIFTGSNAFIQFLGNFVLALVREFSILISKSTPLILGCLDVFSKIVGGFYILIAMIFKPSNPNPLNKRTIAYYDGTQKRYDDRHFD